MVEVSATHLVTLGMEEHSLRRQAKRTLSRPDISNVNSGYPNDDQSLAASFSIKYGYSRIANRRTISDLISNAALSPYCPPNYPARRGNERSSEFTGGTKAFQPLGVPTGPRSPPTRPLNVLLAIYRTVDGDARLLAPLAKAILKLAVPTGGFHPSIRPRATDSHRAGLPFRSDLRKSP